MLLAKEFKYGSDILPSNVLAEVSESESPEDAAKRELKEETGVISDDWQYLGYSISLPSFMDFKEHLFVARDIEIVGTPETDAGEKIEIVEIPFKEVLEKIESGEIVQDSTIVAILRTHLLLN